MKVVVPPEFTRTTSGLPPASDCVGVTVGRRRGATVGVGVLVRVGVGVLVEQLVHRVAVAVGVAVDVGVDVGIDGAPALATQMAETIGLYLPPTWVKAMVISPSAPAVVV